MQHAIPSSTQIGVANAYQFNGSVTGDTESKKSAGLGMEKIDDFGLNIHHAFYRTYDPVIGRMMQVDPLAEEPGLISMTLYNAFFNDPILNGDPNGDAPPVDLGSMFTLRPVEVEKPTQEQQIGNPNTGNYTQDSYQGETDKNTIVSDLGVGLQNVGDGLAWAGYAGALFTEGATLGLSLIGEGVSLVGEVVENVGKMSEEGLTKENAIDAGVDIILEATPAVLETAIK